MTKKIELEWPEQGITVSATLLEDVEPELCQRLWDVLEEPLKMVCSHTLSTGDRYSGMGRPPKHPVPMGSQRAPIAKKPVLLSRLKPGMISYSGGRGIGCAYGPHITEPLPIGGGVVAMVEEDDLDKFYQAGRVVWHAQYVTHKPVIMWARRKE